MAIRRTREDKQRAQVKREDQLTYSWQAAPGLKSKASRASATLQTPADQAESAAVHILGYQPQAIYQDLLKTAVMTVVCLVVLVLIKTQVFP